MSARQDTSTFKRFFLSCLFIIIILAFIGLILFGYARTYYRNYKVKEEIASLQSEVKQLEKKKFQSMELLNYVTSDSFVEEKARTELNLKKAGENVIVLPNLASSSHEKLQKNISQEASLQDLPNPIKWWYYFIHRPIAE
jgi:cell division protein FtsB